MPFTVLHDGSLDFWQVIYSVPLFWGLDIAIFENNIWNRLVSIWTYLHFLSHTIPSIHGSQSCRSCGMVCKFYKAIGITPARFADNFASFYGADLTKKCQNQLFSHWKVKVSHVKGLCAVSVHTLIWKMMERKCRNWHLRFMHSEKTQNLKRFYPLVTSELRGTFFQFRGACSENLNFNTKFSREGSAVHYTNTILLAVIFTFLYRSDFRETKIDTKTSVFCKIIWQNIIGAHK